MTARPTIIDFVEKYTREFASHIFLREKPADHWTETTFEQTRLEAYRVAAGLISLGIEKGDKVRVSIRFRGRAITHKDIGRDMIEKMAEETKDIATVVQRPKMEGRSMFLTLAPAADKAKK